MTTIIDILITENDYAEKCLNEHYTQIKAEYDLMLNAEKEVLSQKKWKLYNNEKEFPKTKKRYRKSNIIFPIKAILAISIYAGLLFELIFLAKWFDGGLWTWLSWLLSIIITFFSFSVFIRLDDFFDIDNILSLRKIFNDYESDKNNYLCIVNEIKSLPIEISTLEEKVEQLELKYPKIEDLKSYYTSKEFYNKIDINKLLKDRGKKPIMEITTNR